MTATTTLPQTGNESSARARRAMIDSQLRTSGVNSEAVLARMLAVPREEHVPEAARGTAYIDRSIALDNGRRIGAPLFYGMLLTEAQPAASDTVLVVDAGSGYLPALVAPMVAKTDSVSPEDIAAGKGGRDTYSLVLVDGAIENVPDILAKKLVDGGRMITGLVADGVTRLATGRKSAGGVALLPLAEIGIPRLPEFDTPPGWSF